MVIISGLKYSDKEKTAFSTPTGGLYQYNSMPFGLCNAASTFQRIIEAALSGIQWHIAVLYLDDSIVIGNNFDDHIGNLCKIMDRLKCACFKLKPKKCTFVQHEIQFLGHIVLRECVRTDPKKVNVVANMKPPQNVKELGSVLGLASCYRKCIKKNCSSIAKSLFILTQSNLQWNWTTECDVAFNTLKNILVTSPILAYPSIDGGEFILDTDASHMALGAVLSQIQGQEKVIAYGSRTLHKPEYIN